MTDIDILFGRGTITVPVPAASTATVVKKPAMPLLRDAGGAVADALEQTVGSASLSDLARGKRSACILICDITRPVPNALFLRPIIETLLAGGIAREKITVLIATGLHRPNEGAELEELIGDPWVLQQVRVVNHFARNDEDHVDLGATQTRGTPVKLDRRFVEADLRIATGLVEPHFMAGYSGGRKVVAPGIAHQDTIRTFHSARFMEDPAAVQCNLVANPLHEEQLEILKILGPVYGLNTVIDDERRLSLVNFGEITAAHLAAVAYVEDYCKVALPRRFDTVVTSAAGFPLDQTYYQTVKGMVTPLDIVAPGGTLIVVAECAEGFGSAAFKSSQARLIADGPEQFLAALLAKRFADVDE